MGNGAIRKNRTRGYEELHDPHGENGVFPVMLDNGDAVSPDGFEHMIGNALPSGMLPLCSDSLLAKAEEQISIAANENDRWAFLSERLRAVGIVCAASEDFKNSYTAQQQAEAVLRTQIIKLISARWLKDCCSQIIRCQNLPLEASIMGAYAAQLCSERAGLIMVSYGWLTPMHPDPTGFHLSLVQRYLRIHFAWLITGREQEFAQRDWGVFWDFMSLPQSSPDGTGKTIEERHMFQIGLNVVATLFGSMSSLVIQLKATPPAGYIMPNGSQANLTEYNDRGWCFFEEVVASALKDSELLLDLSLPADLDQCDWPTLTYAATKRRRPPVAPFSMEQELTQRQFTMGKVDNDQVVRMYKDFFRHTLARTEKLDFSNLDWGDEEMQRLAMVLPSCSSCKTLYLFKNRIENGGAQSLAAALPETSLLTLVLRDNCIGNEGMASLAEVLPRTKLEVLNLDNNKIGDVGMASLANALSTCGLTLLRLVNNPMSRNAEQTVKAAALEGCLVVCWG